MHANLYREKDNWNTMYIVGSPHALQSTTPLRVRRPVPFGLQLGESVITSNTQEASSQVFYKAGIEYVQENFDLQFLLWL